MSNEKEKSLTEHERDVRTRRPGDWMVTLHHNKSFMCGIMLS